MKIFLAIVCFTPVLLCLTLSTEITRMEIDSTALSLTKSNGCPCSNPDWCDQITDFSTRREIFAFSVKNDSQYWSKYDWTKITTVVMAGYVSDELMCMAHALKARVSYIANVNFNFNDPTLRKRWIEEQVTFIQTHHLDGINFDFEGVIAEKDTETRDSYTRLVAETNTILKKVLPSSQVTVDVAWIQNVDKRFYDYKALADNCDFLFVMSYDEQSQIYGDCLAMPNSGFVKTMAGLGSYISQGIPRSKLVLGVPWYGYIYPCVRLQGDNCLIKHVPFRGVACSDAAGKEFDYAYIKKLASVHTVKWNSTSSTPFFTYASPNKTFYQVQFDNPKSLALKYKLSEKLKLKGVGMWTIDSLNYEDSPEGLVCRREMFGVLP